MSLRRALLLTAAAASLVTPLSAQQQRTPEAQALREAGALETRGKLPEAEELLVKLLEGQPNSVGGLFALERVLRAEGKISAVLAPAARFLSLTPDASGVRLMRLKVLTEVDSADAAIRAAEEWVKRSPTDPMLYREALPLLQKAYDPKRSLELVREARKGSGAPLGLALELGDLFMGASEYDAAATEWARAAGTSGERATEILKRLGAITDPSERARMATTLMDALVRSPSNLKQKAVAVQVALAFERVELGLQMAKALAPELDPTARRAFYENVSAWGTDESAGEVVLWALGEIRSSMAQGEDTREIDTRINKAAVAAGDTATAIEVGQRLAARLPKGNAERRRLLAEEIRMRSRRSDTVILGNQWEAFRQEFPQAPELDELAALVSTGLQSGGQGDEASVVLASVQGPESSLERAYIQLADGNLEIARALLILAVPGLAPSRGAAELQVASLLGRMSPAGQLAVAKAAVDAHKGRGREAAVALELAVPDLPELDRPLALGEAARLADDVGADEEAARIRTTLVAGYPEALDTPEATLALARWHARSRGGVATAIDLLENLILHSPDSAVAPDARRELQRLRTM